MEFNFLNASPVPMVLYKEKFIYANEAFFTMSGYNEEDLKNKYVWDFFEEDAKEPFKAGIQDRLKNNMPKKEYTFKFYTKNNEVRWLKIGTTTVIHNEEYIGFATLFDRSGGRYGRGKPENGIRFGRPVRLLHPWLGSGSDLSGRGHTFL